MKRILAILPFAVLTACHHQEAALTKTVTPVRVTAVDTYQPKGGGRYSATILPGRQVTLSFRVSGLVQSIHQAYGRALEPGDIVAAGTVLANVREEDYRHNTAQAHGQLAAAQAGQKSAAAQYAQALAGRTKAERDYARAKTLLDQQSLVRPEYDAAKAALDGALAQVDAARAQMESAAAQVRQAEAAASVARLNQSDTALVAPFSAAIVQRTAEVGMLASPGQAAYTLADIGTVKAAFGVPDTVMTQLRRGKAIAVTAEALPGQEFQGTVTAIAAVADAETRLFQVEVALSNRTMALKPGMIAAISIGETEAVASVPVVPLSAVIRDRANPADFAVMVVENKVARARRVSLGQTFGDVLAVTSGVKPGELVIRAGATMVVDGEVVEVIP